MDLKTWAPLIDLEMEMRQAVDRYFPPEDRERFLLRVPVNMSREGDTLIVTVELPGVDLEDVDVSVEGDTLIISGEKMVESETKDEDRLLWERRHGRFERRMALPDGVDLDAVTATFDNGVLTVKVPTPVEITTRHKISVEIPVETTA